MSVCLLQHTLLCKDHVGGAVFCRVGDFAHFRDLEPPWRALGTMGTEGSEGETADADVPESWAWTHTDRTLTFAALQVHTESEWY